MALLVHPETMSTLAQILKPGALLTSHASFQEETSSFPDSGFATVDSSAGSRYPRSCFAIVARDPGQQLPSLNRSLTLG